MIAASPNVTLYLALALYGLGTLQALASLFTRSTALQKGGLAAMIAGWVSHTIWIGTICTLTGRPPLTNLAEASSFVGWTVFAVELGLLMRFKVHAAAFFVYPLVLILTTLAAVVRESFVRSDTTLSRIFTAHLLLSTLGVAGLLVGLAFTWLAYQQDRALKSKTRGRLWDWIPSLNVCRVVSQRALAIGFCVYTLGLVTGVVWAYRTSAGPVELRAKEVGAVVAWIFFALLLQGGMTGGLSGRRMVFVSAGALIAVAVAILGINHV